MSAVGPVSGMGNQDAELCKEIGNRSGCSSGLLGLWPKEQSTNPQYLTPRYLSNLSLFNVEALESFAKTLRN